MRRGVWDYARTRPLGQCRGRVFGVVGMGEIGRAAAKKAAGMGFEVVCWSRSLKPGRRTPEGYPVLRLEELLQTADVVSLHTALTPETHHLINAERLALMKPDAVLVNTARGAVVDTVALAQALCEDKLWGRGLGRVRAGAALRLRPSHHEGAAHRAFGARGVLVGGIRPRTA